MITLPAGRSLPHHLAITLFLFFPTSIIPFATPSSGMVVRAEVLTPEQIDCVMQDWGMAMGPLAVGDLAGLDIGYKARQSLSEEQKGDAKIWAVADALVEMDRLGQKSGSGYYQYDADTRARSNDPVVMEVVEEKAAEYGVERRDISDEEILNRLIFALVNEGARILDEGIAQRSGDIL